MNILCSSQNEKDKKTEENKKKKRKDGTEEDDLDLENLDWWSKYFASVELMMKVRFLLPF